MILKRGFSPVKIAVAMSILVLCFVIIMIAAPNIMLSLRVEVPYQILVAGQSFKASCASDNSLYPVQMQLHTLCRAGSELLI